MFGRHLRLEYKADLYQLVDQNRCIVGTRYMRLREPAVVVVGGCGVVLLLTIFMTCVALPFFGVVISEAAYYCVLWLAGLAAVFLGYLAVSEPDMEEIIYERKERT